jgi:type I restriction enzyme S subunit
MTNTVFPLQSFSEMVELNPSVSLASAEAHPFIPMDEVKPGLRYVKSASLRKLGGGARFSPGDTLFARITPCLENGKIAQFDPNANTPGFGSTEFIVLRAKPKKADAGFIFYLSKTDWVREPAIKSMAGASGRQRARAEAVSNALVPAVPLPVQRRIASILGAYDDLIELNRRRIALLEEMARRLFEEWFVRFRFPEHEGHSMVESPEGTLPEGWEWLPLELVCARPNGIQTGPFGSQLHQSDYVEYGVPVVMPKNIIGFRVVQDDIARISEHKADELGRHRMKVGDVVYGRRGDIGRRAYVSQLENGWFCGTGCLRLRPDLTKVSSRYFFDALGQPETLGAIRGRAQGVTMPNLSAGVMAGVPVKVPPLVLQQDYERLLEPIAELSASLQSANHKLGSTRDLLLSRLISGELSVSKAERKLEAVA